MADSAGMSMLFAWSDGSNFHAVCFLFFTDHPLHSTAVDAYGEEQSGSESLGRASAPQRKRAARKLVL